MRVPDALVGLLCLALSGCATRLPAPAPRPRPPADATAPGILERIPVAPEAGRTQHPGRWTRPRLDSTRAAFGTRRRTPLHPVTWPSALAAIGLLGGGVAALALVDKPTLSDVADWGENLSVGSAVAAGVLHRDPWGLMQYGGSFGSAIAVVHGLKNTAGKRRPDRSTPDSYPSAHTAAAFSSAAFLHARYGPGLGLPAYAAASITALSRVRTKRHFLDDAIAGAGIALITSWLLVRPWPQRLPWGRPHREATSGWRVAFAYRAVWGTDDHVRAPEDGGTRFNLTRLDDPLRAVMSARLTLERRWGRGHELVFGLDPIDIVDTGALGVPVRFADELFPAGTAVRSRQHLDRYRLGYRRQLSRRARWTVKPGVALLVSDYFAELGRAEGKRRVRTARVLGMPTLVLGRRLVRRLDALVEVAGIAWGDTRHLDLRLGLRWHVARTWDLGVGFRYLQSAFRTPALSSSFDQSEGYLEIARRL